MLRFRNLTITPDDPVEHWGFEGLLAATERGEISDWSRIVATIRNDPWGEVAQTLAEVFEVAEDVGVVAVLRRALDRARTEMAAAERRQVAESIQLLVARSGLTRASFAERIGTSRSRLSTYTSGKVTPSAALLVRMQRLADSSGRGDDGDARPGRADESSHGR